MVESRTENLWQVFDVVHPPKPEYLETILEFASPELLRSYLTMRGWIDVIGQQTGIATVRFLTGHFLTRPVLRQPSIEDLKIIAEVMQSASVLISGFGAAKPEMRTTENLQSVWQFFGERLSEYGYDFDRMRDDLESNRSFRLAHLHGHEQDMWLSAGRGGRDLLAELGDGGPFQLRAV